MLSFRRVLLHHLGLLSAAVGVAIASAFYLGGFHAIGMVIACTVALSWGDAWDAEGR